MATWRDVQNLIRTIAEDSLSSANVPAVVGVGYPPVRALQNVARSGVLVSVYDHGLAPDKTRWIPFPALPSVPILSALSISGPSSISAGTSGTIAISGSPIPEDTLSITVLGSGSYQGASYTEPQSGSLDSFCEGFVTAFNTDAVTSYGTPSQGISGMVASYLGAGVIELQNNRAAAVALTLKATNGSVVSREIRRVMRQLQVTAWANSPDLRDTVCDPIEQAFSEQQVYFGSQFPDGTWARILLEEDISIEDNTLQDVFRRDFVIGCEYGILQTVVEYPIAVTQIL